MEDGRKRQLCPVCHEPKTHLSRHLRRCGLRSGESERPLIECNRMVEEEEKRVSKQGLVCTSVTELVRDFGKQWGLIAEALCRYGVPISTGIGLGKRLDSEERVDEYLSRQGLKVIRSNPCRLESTAVDKDPVDSLLSLSKPETARKSESTGCKRVSLDHPQSSSPPKSRPAKRFTSFGGLSSSVSTSWRAEASPLVQRQFSRNIPIPQTSVPMDDSGVFAPSGPAGFRCSSKGARHISKPMVSAPCVVGLGSSQEEYVASADGLSPSATSVESGLAEEAMSFVSPYSHHTAVDQDMASRNDSSPPPSVSEAASSADGETTFIFPPLDEFFTKLTNVIDSLDWFFLQSRSQYLFDVFENGRKNSCFLNTSYVKVCDEFVQRVEKSFNFDLISRLQNTPGMLCSADQNKAFIQQCVVVAEIAKHFSRSIDPSQPPLPPQELDIQERGKPRAPSSTRTPASTSTESSTADVHIMPPVLAIPVSYASHDSLVLPPCRVVLEDIKSPQTALPVVSEHSRGIKRKPVIESAEESPKLTLPKRKLMRPPERAVLDTSEASSDPVNSEREKKIRMAKIMEDNHLHLGLFTAKYLRKTNKYIQILRAALSADHMSKDHIDNIIGNVLRIMKFFATGNDPRQFRLEDLTSTDKLNQLAQVLTNAGCTGETKAKYFQSLKIFIEKVRKSDYRKSHPGLILELQFMEEQVSDLQKRTRIQKKQDKMDKLADMAHREDLSAKGLQAFREAVNKLESRVRKVILKCTRSDAEAAKPGNILLANVYFLSLFVQYGHRPVVFRKMLLRWYEEAKAAQPVSIQKLGLVRMLVSSKHKTGPHFLAFVPLKEPEQFNLLCDYVNCIRPQPADETARELLFLNSAGRPMRNMTHNMKQVMSRLKLNTGTVTEVRHFIETLAHNTLEGKDKEDVSTFLCHSPETARAHYLDSFTTSGLQGSNAILRLQPMQVSGCPLPGQSVQQNTSQEGRSVSPTQTVNSRANTSSIQSGGSTNTSSSQSGGSTNTSSSQSGGSTNTSSSQSGGSTIRRRDATEARRQFLKEHFEMSVGTNPTQAEYLEKLRKHSDAYPELKADQWKNFNTLCGETRNRLRAKALIEDLGNTANEITEDGLRAKLEEKGWYNQKTLAISKLLYDRMVLYEEHNPQHPSVNSTAAPNV